MEPGILALGAGLLLGVQCCIASWLDFRYRTLPNILCLAVLCSGLLAGAVMHDLAWVGMSALHALAALVVGAALFAVRFIGGGDAKFYAAIAAWVPFDQGLVLLMMVSLSGLVLLLFWFPMRRRIAAMAPDTTLETEFRKVPYGIAIAAGGFLAFSLSSGVWSMLP